MADAVGLARDAGSRGELSAPGPHLSADEAAVIRAASLVGAMGGVLECAVAHASSREQFGAVLRTFQAVQGLLARIAAEFLLAEAALDAAVARVGTAGFTASADAAKAQASMSAGAVSALAHQVLGAVGFTQEHELGRLTGLLAEARELDGDEFAHAHRLGTVVLDGDDTYWARLVDCLDLDAQPAPRRGSP